MINETVPVPASTVYPSNRRKVALLLLASVVFVVLSVLLLLSHPSVKGVIGGVIGVPFFGAAAVLLTKRLIQAKPELILDQVGLEHVQLGRIAWAEVAGLRIREVTVRTARQRMVELELHQLDAYLARAPRSVRMAAAANRSFGYGPVTIAVNTLPVSLEELVAVMVRYHPQLAVGY